MILVKNFQAEKSFDAFYSNYLENGDCNRYDSQQRKISTSRLKFRDVTATNLLRNLFKLNKDNWERCSIFHYREE